MDHADPPESSGDAPSAGRPTSLPTDPGALPTTRADGADPDGADRFPAGTLLDDRYRIVGRLGRGGMGEVYRADDLTLGQSVALKFLPPDLTHDRAWLDRLRDEVRIARTVAHPSVCRTYDIGRADGIPFISMEFVDGDDLAALLRRIGRLPSDKAVDIARQLCAGLAAAHDKGVLHRDLKPANIMLDGRGQVRITDFGIAAIADAVDDRAVRAGTPQYMAPEQLDGTGVTARSDLYALGLILYEIFTGQEPFHATTLAELRDRRRTSTPTTPRTLVPDLDPAVERVIMRCLEQDPNERPASALAVAAALPGGDPLAMALAAGETPSPEMVALAGDRGGLRPGVAVALWSCVLVLLLLVIGMRDRVSMARFVPMDQPPEVLAHTAETLARSFGYERTLADRHASFRVNPSAREWVQENSDDPDRWSRARTENRIPLVEFVWRGAPRGMTPTGWRGEIGVDDPVLFGRGMVRARLDSEGDLISFEAVPYRQMTESVEESMRTGASTASRRDVASPTASGSDPRSEPRTEPVAMDWTPLLVATGIPIDELEVCAPAHVPPFAFDERAAWRWTGPGSERCSLRLEGASWRGRPTWFAQIRPWDEDAMLTGAPAGPLLWLIMGIALLPFVGAALLAFLNLRSGRGDRRGALHLAIFFLAVAMVQWIFLADRYLSTTGFPLATPALAFGRACAIAFMVWLFYLALEPLARRYWPRTIVSWARLLDGRWRDPMVGRDVLLGALSAAGLMAIALVLTLFRSHREGLETPIFSFGTAALGGRHTIGTLFESILGAPLFLGLFLILLLARIVVRRTDLAVGLVVIGGAGANLLLTGDPYQGGVALALLIILSLVSVRLGLLAVCVLAAATGLMNAFPTTLDVDTWYAGVGLVGPVVVLACAGVGAWIATGGGLLSPGAGTRTLTSIQDS